MALCSNKWWQALVNPAINDEYITRATDAGATLTVPGIPVKPVGWLAYCKDTEGNIFGMMQNENRVL